MRNSKSTAGELMGCREEESRLRRQESEEASKRRGTKQQLLLAGRLSSRLREELAAEEWQNEASSSQNSRLQEEVKAEKLQQQVCVEEHAASAESNRVLFQLNKTLLRGGHTSPVLESKQSLLRPDLLPSCPRLFLFRCPRCRLRDCLKILGFLRPLYSDVFRDYWKLEEKHPAGPAADPKSHDLQPANARCSSQELITSFLYSVTERDSILEKMSCKVMAMPTIPPSRVPPQRVQTLLDSMKIPLLKMPRFLVLLPCPLVLLLDLGCP